VRILHVNKFLYRRGGAEGYMFDVAGRQLAAGHEVAFFGMQHPENDPMPDARSFPTEVGFEPPPPTIAGKAQAFGRMLWSTSAARGIGEVADRFGPDIAHLHNVYHQLSPSILSALRRRGVPAVMTLHDYKLVCPTYRLLDHGQLCEACLPRRLWNPVLRRCQGGSLTASTAAAVELSVHTLLGAYGHVARFACPSRFLLGKMREGHVYPARLRWLPNFVDLERWTPSAEPGTGAVYAGRLSDEKGVDVLIRAVALAPGAQLEIVGDGPARPGLETLVDQLGLRDRVTFHGRLDAGSLAGVLTRAAVAVVPSRWYENQPLAVLEAFASGLPVVATDLGGIPELIEPGVDGQLVPADDPPALAAALRPFLEDPSLALRAGAAGRAKVEREHGPELHLERLMTIYDEARVRVAS
jgi:glycosyltransferase involved in cell wall biosynthesis